MQARALKGHTLAGSRREQQRAPNLHARRPTGPEPLRMAVGEVVDLAQGASADSVRAMRRRAENKARSGVVGTCDIPRIGKHEARDAGRTVDREESDVGEQVPIAYVMSRGGMPPV